MKLEEIREKLRTRGYDTAHGTVDTYQIAADILDNLIEKFGPD